MQPCDHCKSVQPIRKHISECVTYPSYVSGNKCVGSYRTDKSGRFHLVQVLNVLESGSFLLKYLAETQPRIIRRVMRELGLFRLAGFVFLFLFLFFLTSTAFAEFYRGQVPCMTIFWKVGYSTLCCCTLNLDTHHNLITWNRLQTTIFLLSFLVSKLYFGANLTKYQTIA